MDLTLSDDVTPYDIKRGLTRHEVAESIVGMVTVEGLLSMKPGARFTIEANDRTDPAPFTLHITTAQRSPAGDTAQS